MSLDRLRWAAIFALLVIAAGCSGGPASPAPSSASPSATGQPSATPQGVPAKMIATIPVPGNPGGMISADGSIWVASRHGNVVVRIDPTSNNVTATIPVEDEPAYFVDDGHDVWVVEFGADKIARIDPKSNAATQVPLPAEAGGWPVIGAGSIWQGTTKGLARIDPTTATVMATTSIDTEAGVAFADGLLWVGKSGGVDRLDPATLKVKDSVLSGTDAGGVVGFDGHWMWIGGSGGFTQVDPATGSIVKTYPLPNGIDPGMTAASAGRLWIQREYPVSFAYIDGASKTLNDFQLLPSTVTEGLYLLGVDDHDAYIADWDANAVYRVDPAP
jgi:YVTN family beta-propeller protein